MSAVRVVVVEASRTQRVQIARALEAHGDIAVAGEAATAADGLALVERCQPDLVIVDLELADGSGQHLIEQIMGSQPTPILAVSAATDERAAAGVEEALGGGALGSFTVPAHWSDGDGERLRRTVRSLSKVHVIRHPRGRLRAPVAPAAVRRAGAPIVAIAASTGGPQALATVLSGLADLAAPVLVVQHLHPDFVDGFASWMRRVSALPVVVAEHRQPAEAGRVYVAPGAVHLRLGAGSRVELSATPETVHRPSADELFHSVATHAGANGIGVILTGIGDDGARGLLAIAQAGGRTLGQDETSSAVFGMPRAAGSVGAVQQFLDPAGIARALRRLAGERLA